MKTLEDIMRDVTPPETWRKVRCACGDPVCRQWHLVGPSRTDGRVEKPDVDLILRAARNFVPLVMALQDMLEVAWPNESQPDSRTNKAIDAAKSALNQALADEP